MEYEKANISDFDEIFSLYQLAIQDMRQKGIDQWDEYYPSKEIVQQDILHGDMYVAKINNKIVAVAVVNEEQDEEYCTGNWICNDGKTAVIHRLCVKPEYQGRGIAQQVLHEVESKIKFDAYNDIRLDAFSENPHALNLYQKLGYKEAGEVYFRKGKFVLFEKVI